VSGAREPKTILAVCDLLLQRNGIARFQRGTGYYWLLSGELMQDLGRTKERPRIFGYPVREEWLIGEDSLYLMQTVDSAVVPR
jgi:hypothetical protein